MRIITREKGLLLAVICLAACLVGAVLAAGGTVLRDAAAAENQALDQATLSWVESDGQHVNEKNLFEMERLTYTLPVNVNGVKFQIWNCTTQTNEAEVTSNDSQISVSLLKDHNYIFFCMDKTYQVQTNRNLYVWARGTDGKLVSTKSMTKASATAESVWSYPEIKEINLVKRETPLDDVEDARRADFEWEIYLSGASQAIGWPNMKVHFVSTLETADADVYTDEDGRSWTKVSASLLEDVDYMVFFDRGGNMNWTMSLLPLPLVYKDKSEYPENLRDIWPLVGTYDHRSCYSVRSFSWDGVSSIKGQFDTLTSEDGNTTVSGTDFTTSGADEGRDPKLLCKDVTSQHKNLLSHDYSVYSIKAENTSRSEALKIRGLKTGTGDTIDVAFTFTQKVESGKTVGNVYELLDDGSLSKLDTFSQSGDVVTFTTDTLSAHPVVVEYSDEALLQTALNLKAVDQNKAAVKDATFELTKTAGDGPSSFTLPVTDAYGKTSKDFKAETISADATYSLKLSGSSATTMQSSVTVKFGKTADGKVYIKSVNGAEYAGADVSVSLKVPVTRSELNIKVVDALQQPKGAVCLKLVPFSSNTQHKTQQIISTKSKSDDGMITKDISDLIPTGTTTEMWNVVATTASDSGADGANESSAQLKNIYVISVNGKASAAPGIASWGVATKAGEKPSSMTEYGGQFTVTAITYALVTYRGSGKINDQFVNAEVGATLAEPKTAAVSNYTLEGWYKDSAYKTKWDFSKDKVTGDVTLYAKWSVNEETLYRLYNPYSGEHLFTKDTDEYNNLAKGGWKKEGVAWKSPVTSGTKVYRLYNPYSGDHHYTTSKTEYDDCGKAGWNQEGVAWYSDDNKGKPVYRLFNPFVTIGTHHYSTIEKEYNDLGNGGWSKEGVGWYALS